MQLISVNYHIHSPRGPENKSMESVITTSLNHMKTVFMEILLLSLMSIETSTCYLKLDTGQNL